MNLFDAIFTLLITTLSLMFLVWRYVRSGKQARDLWLLHLLGETFMFAAAAIGSIYSLVWIVRAIVFVLKLILVGP